LSLFVVIPGRVIRSEAARLARRSERFVNTRAAEDVTGAHGKGVQKVKLPHGEMDPPVMDEDLAFRRR